MEDQRETAEHFQPRQIKRETDTDGPRQDFVIIDVISELERIERLDRSGINENSADNQIHNSPDEFHDSEQTSNIQRPTPNAQLVDQDTLGVGCSMLSVRRLLHFFDFSHSSQPP